MLKNVRGFLIDLEGTVYRGNVAIDGAAQALAKLKDLGFGYRFVTNTTTLRRSSIQKKLVQLGIPAHENEVFSAPYAAVQWLSMKPGAKSWVLTQGDVISEFEGLNLSVDEPDYIVLGDLRNDFSFDLLNRVFRALISGGELIAKVGKGNYVFTGYAWFRQLPAGVPGAYRLFANLISLPKAR